MTYEELKKSVSIIEKQLSKWQTPEEERYDNTVSTIQNTSKTSMMKIRIGCY